MYKLKNSIQYINSFFVLFFASRGIYKLKFIFYLLLKFLNNFKFVKLNNKDVKIVFKDVFCWFGLFSGELGSYVEIFIDEVYELIPTFKAKKGDTVVDVGGNIGFYAIKQSVQIGREGRMWVFEPNVDVFQRLVKNLKENKITNAIPLQKAISSKSGTDNFKVTSNATQEGSLCYDKKMLKSTDNIIEVDCITLDDFVSLNNIFKINILKIDAEGSEFEILKGGLKKALPITQKIVMEFHGNNIKNKIIQLLEKINFISIFEDKKNRIIYFKNNG